MKLKIGTIVVCAISFVIIFSSIASVFAQSQIWESCIIYAYGTDVDDEAEAGILRFTAATPPTGSDIPNTIYVMDDDTGENYTITLADGDSVSMNYQFPEYKEIDVAAEADHYNSTAIPEFSSMLIVPLFLIATVLTIVYRKKRTSSKK